ncbi:hypothetical protein PQR75_46925 [Paraburkholderia fungorum]|uniref:hypothetical protein n=1 Tax=Paraburkholderia fungorum TaxID=134537 RepID=UPI0038BCAD6E
MNEIGIFRDAREALVFALNYQGKQYATSTLARLAQEGTIGNGRGLFGLDGSAMAGMLRARLERLEGHQSVPLIARCADVTSAPWLTAVSEITGFILSTEAGRAIDFEILNSSVRKHFGERQTDQQIANRAGKSRVTVNIQRLAIKPDLEHLEAEAWANWDSSLRAAGLI